MASQLSKVTQAALATTQQLPEDLRREIMLSSNLIGLSEEHLILYREMRAAQLGLDPLRPAFDFIPSNPRRDLQGRKAEVTVGAKPNRWSDWTMLKCYPNQVALYALAGLHGWSASAQKVIKEDGFFKCLGICRSPSGRTVEAWSYREVPQYGIPQAMMSCETAAKLRAIRGMAAESGIDLESEGQETVPQEARVTIMGDAALGALPPAEPTISLQDALLGLAGKNTKTANALKADLLIEIGLDPKSKITMAELEPQLAPALVERIIDAYQTDPTLISTDDWRYLLRDPEEAQLILQREADDPAQPNTDANTNLAY